VLNFYSRLINKKDLIIKSVNFLAKNLFALKNLAFKSE